MYEEGLNGRFITVDANDTLNTTGKKYWVYIPNNVSTDTKMHVYLPGEDGNSMWNVKNSLKKNGCNSIVVFPKLGGYSGSQQEAFSPKNMEILDNVAAVYGGDNQHVSVSGASTGGLQALYTATEASSLKYNSRITSCAYMDSMQTKNITNQQLQQMANNGITLYMNSDDDAVIGSQAVVRYAKMGGVVVVSDYGAGNAKSHNEKCNEPFQNNVIDWLNGTGDLQNTSERRFFTYDTAGNKIEITYEKAKSLMKNSYVSQYVSEETAENYDFGLLNEGFSNIKNKTQSIFGVLKNSQLIYDDKFLYTSVNDITNCVNSTLFLDGISNNGYQSTVDSLPREDSLIGNYFNISTELLDCIIFEMENCINAALSIEETNKYLENEVGNIIESTPSVIPSIPSVPNIKPTTSTPNVQPAPSVKPSTPEGTPNPSETPSTPSTPEVNPAPSETLTSSSNSDAGINTSETPSISNTPDVEPTPSETPTLSSNSDAGTNPDETPSISNTPNTNQTPLPGASSNQPSASTTKTSDNGINPVGIAIGAAALGGAAYAGKKIYDKKKEADNLDDEEKYEDNEE